MTLNEMKIAVCEKLPELIEMRRHTDTDEALFAYWKSVKYGFHQINWPTEGLQVCHEAEKLLLEDEWATYSILLHQATCRIPCNSPTCGYTLHATYEQRLETLCRIWWPENSKT